MEVNNEEHFYANKNFTVLCFFLKENGKQNVELHDLYLKIISNYQCFSSFLFLTFSIFT